MFDVLEKINKERMRRGWIEYQLALNSGIAQSTISTWYRKKMQPTISSLEKICNGLGITLAQFFSTDTAIELSAQEQEFLELFHALNLDEQKVLIDLMEIMDHNRFRSTNHSS